MHVASCLANHSTLFALTLLASVPPHPLLPVRRYDKHKILQKEITNTQYVACLNPTAGSFAITPRMQRHFATFAVQMPSNDIVK